MLIKNRRLNKINIMNASILPLRLIICIKIGENIYTTINSFNIIPHYIFLGVEINIRRIAKKSVFYDNLKVSIYRK